MTNQLSNTGWDPFDDLAIASTDKITGTFAISDSDVSSNSAFFNSMGNLVQRK
ncbi:MAG: hypothetical protein AAF754_13235 [Pseudomonadota bacterium]